MRLMRNWEKPELAIQREPAWQPKRKNAPEGFGVVTHRVERGSVPSVNHCGKCGNEVKVFVSPKRNPHSSKLGRAVSMKDHDLCRRCWRRLMHQQRNSEVVNSEVMDSEVVTLPLSLFIGGGTLRPRLLRPMTYAMPREAV